MTEINKKINYRTFWNRNRSHQSSVENNIPSERSRRSILEGSKAFIWNSELLRTDKPYSNHKYDAPFNPPPNEINYIGGIGKDKGRSRSKLHPGRPTLLQKLCGMTRLNKIDVSFTQPLTKTNNCVPKRKNVRRCNTNLINNIIQNISFSEFKDDRSTPSELSSSNDIRDKSATRSKSQLSDSSNACTIDGKPFYIDRNAIHQKAHSAFGKVHDKTLDITQVMEKDRNFNSWANKMRTKFKNKNTVKEKMPSSRNESESSSICTATIGSISVRRHKLHRKTSSVVRATHGHVYGPIQGPTAPDNLTLNSNKFGVPMTMINRVYKAHCKKKIRQSVLRRVRFMHMGYVQPPDRDESSDNESLQNVKKLALIRTPYFVIPTIKISQVKKKDRFRNKYLKKDRLKRINLLLEDRKGSANPIETEMKKEVGVTTIDSHANENGVTKKHEFFAKFFQLSTKQKTGLKRDPEKERYYNAILNKFNEHRQRCEPQKKQTDNITFDEFKQLERLADDVYRKEDESEASTFASKPVERLPNRHEIISKLFRRKKNYHVRKLDDVEGPLYIDPFITEKLENPKEFLACKKTYTNLMKTRFNIRNRLQVNVPELNDERIGGEHSYFTRLATEWDEYYIHELRHRIPVKKFRVKSDILMMRELVRKTYLMYYNQENLLDLKRHQTDEEQKLSKMEAIEKARQKKFTEMTKEAYGRVVVKNMELENIQITNRGLKMQRNTLVEEHDKITKHILIIEKDWEFILLIQNYYYLLMNTEWRLINDWIHRDEYDQLLSPLIAIKHCAKRNMRDKLECNGFAVKKHFEVEIEPILNRMKTVDPDANLLKECLDCMMKKSYTAVIQHNKTFWMFKEVLLMHEKLKEDMKTFKSMQERKIELMVEKQLFMAERQKKLNETGNDLLNQDLSKSWNNNVECSILAITEVLYRQFAPPERITELLIDDITPMDKFLYIHKLCMDLFCNLDDIPAAILLICEKLTRDRRRHKKVVSKESVIQLNRFDMWTKQIRHQFTPIPKFKRANIVSSIFCKDRKKQK